MRKWMIGLMATLVLLVAAVTPAFALEIRDASGSRVGPNEVIDDDVVFAGDTVLIEGTVNGDVFAFANYVEVRGTINGNLVTSGNNLHLLGHVTGSVFAAGSSVDVEGPIDGSLVTAGSRTQVTGTGSVGHSWITAADQVLLDGKVARGMLAGGANIRLQGQVGRELRAYVNNLSIGSQATVAGPVTYYSNHRATIDPAAHTGEVTYHQYERTNVTIFSPWFRTTWIALKFVGFVLAGLLVLALFPALRRRFPELVTEKPWQLPVAGLVALVVFPVALIILLMTVVGIPLSLLGMVVFPGLIYFSQILVAWSLGKLLEERVPFMQNWAWPLVFLIGAMLTTLLVELPGMGGLFGLAWLLYGLGGLWYLITTRRQVA